jgi:hypothetical protein
VSALSARKTRDITIVNTGARVSLPKGSEVLLEWRRNEEEVSRQAMPKRIYDFTQLLNSSIKKPKHFCLLDCVGFFTEGNKFILVFEVPSSPSMSSTPLIPTSTELTVDAQKAAIPTLNSRNQKSKVLSLLQLLDPNLTEIASLSYRFRVAHKIAQAVTSMYARGWMHKGIKSENIPFLGTEDSINP